MYILIIIVLIFFSFFKPKSNTIAILLFLFMWLLMGFNTENADFSNYLNGYYEINLLDPQFEYGLKDPGYDSLIFAFKYLGFDFYQFKIIISFICLFLLYKTIRKFSIYPALVTTCYFLFLFALDVTQFRNFISIIIVIFALRYIIEDEIKGTIIFIILVLLASSIHSSSIFYLLIILKRFKIGLKLILIIVLILVLIVAILKANLFNNIAILIERDEINEIYKEGVSNLAFISMIIVHLINVYYISLYKSFPIENDFKNNGDSIKKISSGSIENSFKMQNIIKFTNSNLVPFMSILVLLLIPFYSDNLIYARLFRNILIFNIIFISNHSFNNPFKSMYINNFILILYASFFFLLFCIPKNGLEKIISPIFLNNSILN